MGEEMAIINDWGCAKQMATDLLDPLMTKSAVSAEVKYLSIGAKRCIR